MRKHGVWMVIACLAAFGAVRGAELQEPGIATADEPGIPISQILAQFAQQSPKPLLVDWRVLGRVMQSPKSLNYADLQAMLRAHSCVAYEGRTLINVVPEPLLRHIPLLVHDSSQPIGEDDVALKVYALDRTDAVQILRKIRPLLALTEHLSAFRPTNSLIAVARYRHLLELESAISTLEVDASQTVWLSVSAHRAPERPQGKDRPPFVFLGDILDRFARRAPKPLTSDTRIRDLRVFAPGVDVENVSFEDLQAILRMWGLVTVETPESIRVLRETQIGPTDPPIFEQTRPPVGDDDVIRRVLKFQKIRAMDLVPSIRPLLPRYTSLISVDDKSNVLVLIARAGNIRTIESIVQELERHAEARSAGLQARPN